MLKLTCRACSPLLFAALVAGCAARPSSQPKDGASVAVVAVPGATQSTEARAGTEATPSGASADSARRALPDAQARAEVIASARWRDPRGTTVAIATELGVSGALLDSAVRGMASGLVEATLGNRAERAAFADVIDLSAPVDVVFGVDLDGDGRREREAMSIGLTSMPRALSALKKRPTQSPSGYLRLTDDDEEGNYGPTCGLFEAAGHAPARLVCGKHPEDLEALGPYLATTLARRELGSSDFHAELRTRGLLDRLGPKLALQAKALPVLAAGEKIGVPAFDDALMEAASALGDEVGNLIADVDSAELDASFDARRGVRVDGTIQFAGAHSWLVQRLVDVDPKGPKVPEIFLRTPSDASTGAYGTGGDPAAFEGVMRVARGLTEGKLTQLGFGTPADRKAIAELLRIRGKKYVGTMSVSGNFGPPASVDKLQDLLGSFVGYQITGIEEPATNTVAWLKDAVKVYNRPTIQKWMQTSLGSEAKFLPTVTIVPAPKALGPGGLDVQVRVSNIKDPMPLFAALTGKAQPDAKPDAAPAVTSLELHLLVASEGDQTYLGIAADRDKLATLLGKLKGKASLATSIAAVPELAAVRTEPHRGASYVTLKGMVGGFGTLAPLAKFAPPDAAGPIERFLGLFGQLPRGGKTPIVFTVDAVQGARPRLSFSGSVTRGTLEDLGYIGRFVAAEVEKLKGASTGSPPPTGTPAP
ncbi:MAG: hypothetical protein FJ096_02320 [Deltaproteobacteria bacterium]|nr:hypothetical protein [Deltaproteobacteria bacterium]